MVFAEMRFVQLLRHSGLLPDLASVGEVLNLERNLNDKELTDSNRADSVKNVGGAAAAQLWAFLNALPNKVGATSHFHLATGMAEPALVAPGSSAHDRLVEWSDVLSAAAGLAGADFSAFTAQGEFEVVMSKLAAADNMLTTRIRFLQQTAG